MPRAQTTATRGLTVWRIVVWLLLLFSGFGCLQYFQHAQLIWHQLQAEPAADAKVALRGMLGWDFGYLLAALALFVICAGGILRQAWARPSLQIAALLLALWLIVSGVLLIKQWHAFEQTMVLPTLAPNDASSQILAALRDRYRLARRSMQLALLFKAAGVPVLLWLSWRLGQASARAQFRPYRLP